MTFETLAKILGILGTLGTGVWFLYSKIGKPTYIRRVIANEQREESARQIIIAIDEIRAVKKQVMPNGGSSLADSLHRIEDKFKEIDDKFDNQQEENRIFYNMQGKAFWESDKEGFTYYISPKLCKLVERSESELFGLGWLSCLIKFDEQRISEEWRKAITEKRVFDEIYSFKSPEGDIKVHACAFPKKDKNQNYTGSIGELSLNITPC